MSVPSRQRRGGLLRSILAGALVFTASGLAQETANEPPAGSTQGVWQFEPEAEVPGGIIASRNMPRRYIAVRLNPLGLDNTLGRLDRAARLGERQVFEVPMPDGTFTRLEVWEDSILGPEMAAKHPEIKMYSGRGIDDPTITARLDQTLLGFHGQLIGEQGTVLIDPLDKDAGLYMTFWKHDAEKRPFECGVTRDFRDDPVHAVRHLAEALPDRSEINLNPVGNNVRRYRLRIVTTFNYTNFMGGVSQAVNQVATTVGRMDGIYAREVSIRFTLLSTDALTGSVIDGGDAVGSCAYPFANSPSVTGAFLTQNHDFLVCRYGTSGWDIGHVVGAGGGGGLAELGAVCRDASKGRGGTQLNNPTGDVFDVDYFSHEVGHQINADHTFNGTSGSCSGNRVAESAFEPGSGTTIMAYAGICSGQNVQANSNDYFHVRSIDQMTDYAFVSGGLCGALEPGLSSLPTVDPGPSRTVPQSTPFRLTATSNGATVNWEQFDLGPAGGAPSSSSAQGPMFRSRPPTADRQRVFPEFGAILSPPSTSWEVLPSVNRDLTFRAIARDNLGGVRHGQTTVSVSGAPFEFTYPSTGDNLECARPETITWNVGGGSIASNVAIKLSDSASPGINGFTNLVASTANDGSHTLTMPANLFGQDRRMMLEPDGGHVFFAVSRQFRIRDTLAPVVTAPGPITKECTSPQGTPVELGLATAADACVGPLATANNAPALFPLGVTDVTWSATDPSTNTGTAIQKVTIEDTTPPVLEVSVTPSLIWPPNHQMVRVRANIVATDVCDGVPTVELVSITANEPDNSLGDGFTLDDVQGAEFGTDDREFFLRAERRGMGTGRIYTITYKATDASGNSTTRQVFVRVPRDLGN